MRPRRDTQLPRTGRPPCLSERKSLPALLLVLALAVGAAAFGCTKTGQLTDTDSLDPSDSDAETAELDANAEVDADGQGDLDDELPTDACAALVRAQSERSLDGTWTASAALRDAGDDWGTPTELGEVEVPGWYFPFERFPSADRDAFIDYRRELPWPADWDCTLAEPEWQALLELDGADYAATLDLDGSELGTHQGYLGRFAVPLPLGASGMLRVHLEDSVHDVDARGGMEAYEHPSLQGADTGGWGVNPLGLPGSVRLRMVRSFYLRDAYATVAAEGDATTTLRIGVRIERLGAETEPTLTLRLRDELGQELATTSRAISLDALGEALLEWDVPALELQPIGQNGELRVELELASALGFADQRTLPLVPRTLSLDADSLQLNGERHFARGAAIHHLYRLLPFTEAYAPGRYVALDATLRERIEAALLQTEDAGVQWLRMGHLLPDAAFLQAVRQHGLLVYQDFPLHWNTDYATLTPDAIEAQFRDFLWRVAAEPAVALIAIHNEAEFGDDDGADLATTQALIDRLLAIARTTAPHLIPIGCSGCIGSAEFAGNDAYPVDDAIADAHSYFGSWWQPMDGYDQIPERVASLLGRTPLPTLWSEMGNGWTRHYVYLCSLDTELEPTDPQRAALRAELESWLRAPDGSPLSLRQWYAGVFCFAELGIDLAGLQACAIEQIQTRTDAEFIAWARRFFMADRALLEADAIDPIERGVAVAAHWLAAQIVASRWLWATGEPFLGVFSWERAENRYPFALDALAAVPPSALERSLGIVAAANAPVALRLAWQAGGELEVGVVNDGEASSLELTLSLDGTSLHQATVELPAAGASSLVVPAAVFQGRTGARVDVAARSAGATVASARCLVR